MMDLFDILLVKKLVEKVNSGDINSPEFQEVVKQLNEKANREEMYAYVEETIANLPALSADDILQIINKGSV